MAEETKSSPEVLTGGGLDAFFKEGTSNEVVEDKEESSEDVKVENTPPTMDSLFDKPKVEVETPKSEVKVPELKSESSSTDFYSNLIKDYIEDGDWIDADVEIEVDGEVQTIALTDLADIDKEKFKEIASQQKALKDEDFKSNYISKEGLDEVTLKMIELKKAGGDISQLIKQESEVLNPLRQINLKDESHQEHLLREKYKFQGLDEDVIQFKINKLKDNFNLDTEAEKVYNEIENNFKASLDAKKEQTLKDLEESKKQSKEFKKKMATSFKDLKIGDNKLKSLMDIVSNEDENGISEVDKAYFDIKSNPDLFAKVALLISDEEAFNTLMGTKIKNKVNKETVKTLFSLKKKTGDTVIRTPKKANSIEDNFN